MRKAPKTTYDDEVIEEVLILEQAISTIKEDSKIAQMLKEIWPVIKFDARKNGHVS